MFNLIIWGYSSVGRAPALQAGGQEFDSPYLHHRVSKRCSGVEPWKLNKEEMNTKQIDNEKNVIEKLGNKALRKANY